MRNTQIYISVKRPMHAVSVCVINVALLLNVVFDVKMNCHFLKIFHLWCQFAKILKSEQNNTKYNAYFGIHLRAILQEVLMN